jgi:hypothetical protein
MQVRMDLSRANISGPEAGTVFHVDVGGAKNHGRQMRPRGLGCQAEQTHGV